MKDETQLEFSGAGGGAVAGFILPLGMTPPNFNEPKRKKSRKKKRIKSLVSESVELLRELFEMPDE
jgi:hypothetical protein